MRRYVMLVDIVSNDPPALFLTGSLPDGNVTDPYTAIFTATGGVSPYVYSITAGALPSGLSLDSATGVVSGTASGIGSFTVTVTVTDELGQTAAVSDSFQITSGPPLEITNSAPTTHVSPAGATDLTGRTAWFDCTDATMIGEQYDPSFDAVDGDGETSRAVKSKSSALYMRGSGTSVTYRAANLGGQHCIDQSSDDPVNRFHISDQSSPWTAKAASTLLSTSALTLVFCGTISSSSTNAGIVYQNSCIFRDDGNFIGLHIKDSGAVVSAHAYVWDGGVKTVAVNLVRDTLCTISMRLSGGTLSIRVDGGAWTSVASGNVQSLANASAVLMMIGKMRHFAMYNTGLTDGQVANIESAFMGGAYSHTYTATGGTAPYTWSVASGTLPTGLTLSSGGVLSGIPSAAGVFNFTVRVTDDDGFTDDLAQTVTVS
jgi:hypothetical protein